MSERHEALTMEKGDLSPSPATVGRRPWQAVSHPRIWLVLAAVALVLGVLATIQQTTPEGGWLAWTSLILGVGAASGAVAYVSHVMTRSSEVEAFVAERTRELADLNEKMRQELAERTAIEASLRESEQRLRSILDHSPAAIFTKDLHGRYTEFNKQAQIWTGRKREEAIGLSDHELFPPEIAKGFTIEDRMVLEMGQVLQREERVPHIDGTYTHFLHKFPIRDEQGKIYALCGISTDIDARKRAEEALHESEKALHAALEYASIILFSLNREGVFTTSLGRGLATIGLKPGEVVGKSVFDLHRDQPAILSDCRRALTGETFTSTNKFNDIIFETRYSPLYNAKGELEGTIGVSSDITDRTKVEDAVREAESRYRGIFENAIEGIYQSTPDGHYMNVNPALARMYGYDSVHDLIGNVRNIQEQIYVDPSVREEFRRQVEQHGEVRGLEYQVRRQDGSVFWISEFARVVRNPDGSVHHYEGAILDISRRKQAEEEKKRMETQMRQAQKMEAVGTLAGGIAHDFNNILGAILGFTEMSLDDVPANSIARSNLENVIKAAHRAKDLVRQILAFSRQGESKRQPIRLGLIVRETLQLIRATLPTTIDISHQIHTKSDTVIADATQLHQVLMNLCANAGHAMRQTGGSLHLQVSELTLEEGRAAEGVLPGKFLRLSVSDTGHGIPKEVQHRIFEPFFTTKTVGEGTGLGLAVVHGIVTTHGGAISVESEPGKGTTFHVDLPQASSHATPVVPRAVAPFEGRERVLIVDDEEALVSMVQQRLRRIGYKVTTKSDSIEALKTFMTSPNQFDLVITDYTMPHMTGVELAKEIKAIRADIPIILCTGYALGVNAQELEALGFHGMLMKPMEFQQLTGMMRDAIEGKAARQPG